MIGQIIGTILSLVGVIFFIVMIYAGVMWMTSRGNTEQAEHSLTMIVTSGIGMIIILSSYAITTFVVKSLVQTSETPGVAKPVVDTPGETIRFVCCVASQGNAVFEARYLGEVAAGVCETTTCEKMRTGATGLTPEEKAALTCLTVPVSREEECSLE